MSADTATALGGAQPAGWDVLAARAPLLATTMGRYIAQQTLTLAPATIAAISSALVSFGLWVIDHDPAVRGVGDIGRGHIEAFKLKCITDVHHSTGEPLAVNTIRQRLRLLKVFFDRIIDWEFTDAPRRNPIIHGDVPPRPEPLPKFLDDASMAAFMHHAENEPDPLRKLCVLLLARTGMRVGELCNLPPDPVVEVGDNHWIHVPVGKLRNDRYLPLHPTLVELITTWQNNNHLHIARTGRLLTDATSAVDRYRVTRMVHRIATRAGIGHVHPHQLRHTLATQAINHGMRLEAVAALLGHKNLEMTLTYARIATDTVAEEYFNATNHIDALYANTQQSGDSMPTKNPGLDTTTTIELPRAQAVVIFDWLTRQHTLNAAPRDPAETGVFNSLARALNRALNEPSPANLNQRQNRSRNREEQTVITGIMPDIERC